MYCVYREKIAEGIEWGWSTHKGLLLLLFIGISFLDHTDDNHQRASTFLWYMDLIYRGIGKTSARERAFSENCIGYNNNVSLKYIHKIRNIILLSEYILHFFLSILFAIVRKKKKTILYYYEHSFIICLPNIVLARWCFELKYINMSESHVTWRKQL